MRRGCGNGVGRAGYPWETQHGGAGFSGNQTVRRERGYSSELCYSLGTGLLVELKTSSPGT